MYRFALLLGLVLLCGCRGFSINFPNPGHPEPGYPQPHPRTHPYPGPHTEPIPGPQTEPEMGPHPAPIGEPAPTHQPPPPYAHLPQRMSFSPKTSVELKTGRYMGNFVLGRVQVKVNGQGLEETIIDGNLVLQTQCVVSNLTVTGDVIFEGHQASLDNVDFFGRIIDKGTQNRY